uniref:Uncharacterized protein n=1 Tax=Rhizophora mucronata TaxID=61149 RepID=A0A2P2KK51_RHIMU
MFSRAHALVFKVTEMLASNPLSAQEPVTSQFFLEQTFQDSKPNPTSRTQFKPHQNKMDTTTVNLSCNHKSHPKLHRQYAEKSPFATSKPTLINFINKFI